MRVNRAAAVGLMCGLFAGGGSPLAAADEGGLRLKAKAPDVIAAIERGRSARSSEDPLNKHSPTESEPDLLRCFDMLSRGKYTDCITVARILSRRNPDLCDPHYVLGVSHFKQANFKDALFEFDICRQMKSKQNFYKYRGAIYARTGKAKLAFADFVRALEQENSDPYSMNAYAWFCATTTDQCFQDGRAATQWATGSCAATEWEDDRCLETLAAGFAQHGQFDRAIKHQKEAIAILEKAKYTEALEGAKSRLALYEQNKPYRE